jgi:hypothetical protein
LPPILLTFLIIISLLFLIIISYPINFSNIYLISFLINASCLYDYIKKNSLPINMNMKRKINMFLFMSMIFILIQIKFNIDINNWKPYGNIRKEKIISWLSLVVCSTVKSKLTIGQTCIQATMVQCFFDNFVL